MLKHSRWPIVHIRNARRIPSTMDVHSTSLSTGFLKRSVARVRRVKFQLKGSLRCCGGRHQFRLLFLLLCLVFRSLFLQNIRNTPKNHSYYPHTSKISGVYARTSLCNASKCTSGSFTAARRASSHAYHLSVSVCLMARIVRRILRFMISSRLTLGADINIKGITHSLVSGFGLRVATCLYPFRLK